LVFYTRKECACYSGGEGLENKTLPALGKVSVLFCFSKFAEKININ
jgi:hypothetical protein